MSRLILGPEAASDIEEIVQYIAKDDVHAAFELQDQLSDTFRMLAKFPGMGRARRDLAGSRKLQFWSVESYLVLYRALGKQIEIVAVLHAARDIPRILRHRNLSR